MNLTRIPKTLQPFINTLQNVIIIEQGKIIHSQLSESFEKLTFHDHVIGLPTMPTEELEQMGKLNQSLMNSTLTLELSTSARLQEPLYVIYISLDKDLTQRTTLHLNASSQLTVIEYLYAANDATMHLFSDIKLSEFAQLNHIAINHITSSNALTVNRLYDIKEGAQLDQANVLFSNALTHQANHVLLNGRAAHATSKTIGIANKTQEMIIKTVIEHYAEQSEGYIEHYGIASDQSTLMFEGVGKIHKNMRRSIAKQKNKGVVIGANARLDANPLLLIDEYDVEAGHGAAIGRIDELQLYYLMSRGLSLPEAERLIINGFLAPFSAMIESEPLKETLQTLLNEKL